ncbi:MAG: TIGR03915 family putative DNA repair protein [Parafilimonas sp.]|nr:TIGR03915 family putative DNA repair protein [Parafilimonas sp.]
MVHSIIYNGSFENFFTAVFEVYEYKITEADIQKESVANRSLFGAHIVYENKEKAERVMKALQQKITPFAFRNLYKSFLSELPGIENVMLRFIQYVIKSSNSVERNFGNNDVLIITETAKKVDREKHRMEAFIRFQKTKDELYYAIVQPDFNVLPLIIKHFKDRYADQRWLVYDVRRKYGIYHNQENVTEVKIDFTERITDALARQNIYDEQEELYQSLWQTYFNSINIKARKNMKLHIQHMPKRYWKYLIEKQPKI